MELKRKSKREMIAGKASFNRTFMELKQAASAEPLEPRAF